MSGKSRTLGRALRSAAKLDHRGTRWLMQLVTPPPTVVVLVNRGRRSGKLYRTPLSILYEWPERSEIVVAPMFGADTDWYRNVQAGGLVELSVRGDAWQVEWRELSDAERAEARAGFRTAYPRYSKLITRRLARIHGDTDGPPDPTAHAQPQGQPHPQPPHQADAAVPLPELSLPMLGLRRVTA